MRMEPVTVRLKPETLKKIEALGNPSIIIRKLIHKALKPIEKEIIIKTVRVPKLVTFGDGWNKMMDAQIIKDKIKENSPDHEIEFAKENYLKRWGEPYK